MRRSFVKTLQLLCPQINVLKAKAEYLSKGDEKFQDTVGSLQKSSEASGGGAGERWRGFNKLF